MVTDPVPVQHYLVRSEVVSRRHHHRVSAYLVHRFADSGIVARIEPLGLVPDSLASHQLALLGLGRNLRADGAWAPTSSRRHTRVRLTPVLAQN